MFIIVEIYIAIRNIQSLSIYTVNITHRASPAQQLRGNSGITGYLAISGPSCPQFTYQQTKCINCLSTTVTK